MSRVNRAWQGSLVCVALLALASAAGAQNRYFVSPEGNDAWSGTRATPDGQGDGPKRTFQGARDAVRAVIAGGRLPRGGLTVVVRPGRYSALQPLTFTAADSGTRTSRVTWRAERPGTVVLDGGARVTQWQTGIDRAPLDKVDPSVRPFVVTADLTANGIAETGRIVHSAPNYPQVPEHAELVFNDEPLVLAQWPNSGWAWVEGTGNGDGWSTPTVRVNTAGVKTPLFDRDSNPGVGEDLWVRGSVNYRMFNHFWEKVSRFDPATGDVRVALESGAVEDPARRTGEQLGDRGRIKLTNSLWELDSPGEYYFDRVNNVVYLYPPSPVQSAEVAVTMTTGPVLDVRGASFLSFVGLTVQNGRHDGLSVLNSNHVSFTGGTVRNVGFFGMRVEGGSNVELRSNRVTHAGETGIHLEGGDRVNLVRGNHRAINNHIWEVGRNNPTYRPGIDIWGLGNLARNNTVHDHDHIGIHYRGNEHFIERNEIFDVCKDTADTAAIYAGWKDYTEAAGVVIRENYIYDVYKRIPVYHLVHGYYQDEMYSSVRTERNVFRNVEQPIQIGSGHYNRVAFNVMVDCVGGIRIDDRGVTQGPQWEWWIRERASRVPWESAAWRRRYPNVFRLLSAQDIRTPRGNQFIGNVFLRSTTSNAKRIWEVLEIWGVNADPKNLELRNNVITTADPFQAEQQGDFTPRRESGLSSKGFTTIRLRTIGVMTDSFIDGRTIGHRRQVQP